MSELLNQAAQLMLVGMSAVIIFLLLLVVAMSAMKRFIPAPTAVPSQTSRKSTSPDTTRPAVLAAISAAIHQYRADRHTANNEEKSK